MNEQSSKYQKSASSETNPMFRIDYDTWWTTKNKLPKNYHGIRVADGLDKYFNPLSGAYGKFFLSKRLLEDGDKYTSIIHAIDKDGEVIGDIAGLYTYGDWKGGFLILTSGLETGLSEYEQGKLWQRIYMTYLAEGIEKIFLYNF